jgi:predicted nucleic acid-binding protein
LASEARALLTDWTRGKIELSVPDLLLIEVANVLWKAPRSRRCKPTEARAALKILISYRLPSMKRQLHDGTFKRLKPTLRTQILTFATLKAQ